MVTIILFALFGVIFAIKAIWEDGYYDFVEIVVNIISTVLITIVSMLIGLAIAFALPMKTETIMEEYKIECLQDNSSVGGSFLLGTGYIDGEMKYVFYYSKDGVFKMKQTSYKNTSIKYSDIVKAECYKQKEVKALINYFAFDDISSECTKRYVLYVPEGSIKQGYNLDAK